jgi:subtilisin family serine protease
MIRIRHRAKLTVFVLGLAVTALAQKKTMQAPAGLKRYTTGPRVVTTGPTKPQTTGLVQVSLQLSDPPLIVMVGPNAKQNGITMSAAQQQAYVAQLKQKQDAVVSQAKTHGAVELARAQKAHNAVVVSIDVSQMKSLSGISGVTAVRDLPDRPFTTTPIPGDNNPDLANTAAYIGANKLQNSGTTGQGIRVAMLDTGIDYTHYNLGGSGNVADYNAAVAVAAGTPPPSLFPTSKVIGGYDFTGEVWPNGALAPDPNPIDINGHGSHTADILGGHSLDNVHLGIAPGTQLYAVKVCSSVASSCSGAAMLQGLEFALDPNNTGTLNNAVDIISMSIGGSFGQREDIINEALTYIVQFGVVGVISAGNDGNIPYILAHPASTPEVLSAAATTSVVATGIPLVINSPNSIAGSYPNTATMDFAPINAAVTSNVVYVGRGCPAGSISTGSAADLYLANPSGQIALIDRGACSVSLKIDAAAQAGAVGVLIGLVAPGDAFSFSNAGGSDFVPSLVITQADSITIQTTLGSGPVNATISPANAIPISGNMASYSSRGPEYSYGLLKPDLASPGTISAAAPGTGNGVTTESGTSFACPTEAGVAALLLSRNHSLTPVDIKALLMENAETTVYTNNATLPGQLAPMSWMGAGEIRADRAAASTTEVWDASEPLAVSLSFGTYRLFGNQTFRKKVVVKNTSNSARTYSITNTYRDAVNTTGVTLLFPGTVTVPANNSVSFTMSLVVYPASLPVWPFTDGSTTGNGNLLQSVEYAGYLTLTDAHDTVHLPWHILPHKGDNLVPGATTVTLNGNPQTLPLTNTGGAVSGQVDSFSLTGVNAVPTNPTPAAGSGIALINLHAVGVRLLCADNACTSFNVQFAINTYDWRAHPDVPAEFEVAIDIDGDGVADVYLYNGDLGQLTGAGSISGQNAVVVYDATNGTGQIYYYSATDLNTGNIILTAPLAALSTSTGLQVNTNTKFNFWAYAFDNFFTGNLTDAIGPMTYELDMPQFYTDNTGYLVAPNTNVSATIFPNNAANPFFGAPYNGNSPSQTGILLLYRDAVNGKEADIITVHP